MCTGQGVGGETQVGLAKLWLRMEVAGQAQGAPVGHGALLSDGVAPHGEAHAHDGAGDEDEEDDEGADQQAQEGVQEGAVGRMVGLSCGATQPTALVLRGRHTELHPPPHPGWMPCSTKKNSVVPRGREGLPQTKPRSSLPWAERCSSLGPPASWWPSAIPPSTLSTGT